MFLAAVPQAQAKAPALPPALARLGIRPPTLPAGWRGTMTVRINQDAPITIPLGEQATVGLPMGMPVRQPAAQPMPAAAGGFGVAAPAQAARPGLQAGQLGGLQGGQLGGFQGGQLGGLQGGQPGGIGGGMGGGLLDLLRQLIAQGRITRVPALRAGNAAANPFGQAAANPFGQAAPARGAAGDAPVDKPAQVKRLLELVNKERAKVGAGPLTLDPKLNTAAQAHSADMAKRGFFSHDTPEGKKFFQRAGEAGTNAFAENIAGGQATPEGALEAWLKSPGHRKNLLNPAFTRMGAGMEEGRWTQMFG